MGVIDRIEREWIVNSVCHRQRVKWRANERITHSAPVRWHHLFLSPDSPATSYCQSFDTSAWGHSGWVIWGKLCTVWSLDGGHQKTGWEVLNRENYEGGRSQISQRPQRQGIECTGQVKFIWDFTGSGKMKVSRIGSSKGSIFFRIKRIGWPLKGPFDVDEWLHRWSQRPMIGTIDPRDVPWRGIQLFQAMVV